MYDGQKIFNVQINPEKWLENPRLNFPGKYDRQTGEPLERTFAIKDKGLLFLIKNGNCKLNGSIHKFNNNGAHNWNDFRFTDVFKAVSDLWNEYQINPTTNVLNKAEVGVNVIIPFTPQKFFDSLIMHEGDTWNEFTKDGAIGMWCKKTHYYIKIYDKSNQYPDAPGYVLRFELSSRKMSFFDGRIITMADYLNVENFIYYGKRLQECFDGILSCDYTTIPKRLNQEERQLFDRGTNLKYWKNLNPDSKKFPFGNQDKGYKRERKKYSKTLNSFKKLVNKYNCNEMQKTISGLIKCKLLILNDYTPEVGDKVTIFLNQFAGKQEGQGYLYSIREPYPITEEVKELNLDMELNNEKGNVVKILPETIELTFDEEKKPETFPARFCLTCGRDISNQRPGTKFCSAKFVGDRQAHKCRNADSNQRHTRNRIIDGEGINPTLFSSIPYIRKDHPQRKQA